MKISARNTLPGIVRKVEEGAVNAEVTIGLAPTLSIVSIIRLDAARSPKLKPGGRLTLTRLSASRARGSGIYFWSA
jgi:molybdopterin-binding protein